MFVTRFSLEHISWTQLVLQTFAGRDASTFHNHPIFMGIVKMQFDRVSDVKGIDPVL
jgi:hypothetical protein